MLRPCLIAILLLLAAIVAADEAIAPPQALAPPVPPAADLGAPVLLGRHWGQLDDGAQPGDIGFNGVFNDVEEWKTFHREWLGEWAAVPAVDFARCRVLAVVGGKVYNTGGFAPLGAWDDGARLLIRLDVATFQTSDEPVAGRPFLFLVVPRGPHPLLIETWDAETIGGPPVAHRLLAVDPGASGQGLAAWRAAVAVALEKAKAIHPDLPADQPRTVEHLIRRDHADDGTENDAAERVFRQACASLNLDELADDAGHFDGFACDLYPLADGRPIRHGALRLFVREAAVDGKAVVERDLLIGKFKDGLKDGLFRYRGRWNERDTWVEERTYRDDLLEGPRRWYTNAGKLRAAIAYHHGKRHGAAAFWRGGAKPVCIGEYADGAKTGTWIVRRDDGSELGRFTIADGTGIEKQWAEDGSVRREIPWQGHRRHGVEKIVGDHGETTLLTWSAGELRAMATSNSRDYAISDWKRRDDGAIVSHIYNNYGQPLQERIQDGGQWTEKLYLYDGTLVAEGVWRDLGWYGQPWSGTCRVVSRDDVGQPTGTELGEFKDGKEIGSPKASPVKVPERGQDAAMPDFDWFIEE